VVVGDFDFIGMTFFPFKTHPPLVVDSYTVLAGAIPLQLFQPITGRHG
jgi:hypothetical protein